MKFRSVRIAKVVLLLIFIFLVTNLMLFLETNHAWIEIFALGATPTPPAEVRPESAHVCKGLKMPLKEQYRQDFMPVSDVSNYAYVYGAHAVDNKTILITSIRASKPNTYIPMFCQLWFSGPMNQCISIVESQRDAADVLAVETATVESLAEGHGRSYVAAFIKCRLPEGRDFKDVIGVSVTTERCGPATNFMKVAKPGLMTSEFTVCVTPLNMRYSRAYELVEMIEMNKLLGAEKIVFYNHSTGQNVDEVLKMYTQNGDVDVHQWHIPVKVDTWPPTGKPEIHYFGQIAALNDCLYRYRQRSRYIVFTDLDEFIVPRKHPDWKTMMHDRQKSHPSTPIFMFQCMTFRKEWPQPALDFKDNAIRFKSVILGHTDREAHVLYHGIRSKLIVDPRKVTVMGIHNVWDPNGPIDRVPYSQAALHHYRSWEQPQKKPLLFSDNHLVTKLGARLVVSLEAAWSHLKGVPMDIDISSYGPFV